MEILRQWSSVGQYCSLFMWTKNTFWSPLCRVQKYIETRYNFEAIWQLSKLIPVFSKIIWPCKWKTRNNRHMTSDEFPKCRRDSNAVKFQPKLTPLLMTLGLRNGNLILFVIFSFPYCQYFWFNSRIIALVCSLIKHQKVNSATSVITYWHMSNTSFH